MEMTHKPPRCGESVVTGWCFAFWKTIKVSVLPPRLMCQASLEGCVYGCRGMIWLLRSDTCNLPAARDKCCLASVGLSTRALLAHGSCRAGAQTPWKITGCRSWAGPDSAIFISQTYWFCLSKFSPSPQKPLHGAPRAQPRPSHPGREGCNGVPTAGRSCVLPRCAVLRGYCSDLWT